MALSGYAAGNVADLVQLMTETDFRRKLAEEQQRLSQSRLNQEALEHADRMRFETEDRARRAKLDADVEAEKGERKRIGNLQSLARQNVADIAVGVRDPEQARKQAAIFAAAGELPEAADMTAELLKPPPEPKRHPMTVHGPDGKPLRRLVSEDELAQGVPEYREPKTPSAPQRDPVADYRARKQIDAEFAQKPTNGGSSEFTLDHSRDVVRKVDELLPRIGVMTAGPVGSLLSNFGGTDAANVSADLQSLSANLAFQQLQKMREASKTGGALGNVANQELDLLKNVEASIRQDQSPANLKKNLTTIRDSAARFLGAAEQSGGIEPMRPASSHGASSAPADPLGIRRRQ